VRISGKCCQGDRGSRYKYPDYLFSWRRSILW